MAEIDFEPFNSVDSTYYLSKEEQKEYGDHNRNFMFGDIIGFAPFDGHGNIVNVSYDESYSKEPRFMTESDMITFVCPETLEQLWYEIDNLDLNSDAKIKNIKRHALLHMIPGEYDSILHVHSGIHDAALTRHGDLILGVKCKSPGPVGIHVGRVHKFTKKCKAGINLFSRDEVIPISALHSNFIDIRGQGISDVIYGTLLSRSVKMDLIKFYNSPNNGTLYRAYNGTLYEDVQ